MDPSEARSSVHTRHRDWTLHNVTRGDHAWVCNIESTAALQAQFPERDLPEALEKNTRGEGATVIGRPKLPRLG